MTLALIAGGGELPSALIDALDTRPLICALDGADPQVPVDLRFRLEAVGSFLTQLRRLGVTRICMAGGVTRPRLEWRRFDVVTIRLLPTILRALAKGDDGALRAFIAVLERRGFTVVAAHDIVPDLLPPEGVVTTIQPSDVHRMDALVGDACLHDMGQRDSGQACIVRQGVVVDQEDRAGTDAMITRHTGSGGILFKGPKPGQDRRADLPVIGPGTARHIIAAGLDGIVIDAGGVMVLNRAEVVRTLNDAGRFLWVRKAPL
ncbi:UDP-2,3-diacylglucosamine diphosphatase LpxI [Loktanella sp. SALINAS62]|uniref:LpxI family protein n=1 Tax=Loktanella sp. SALINAS62 TaxID=2706124 RepID=UPI001B8B0C1D|nr:UDP-2,3-diacylglucosamine diphosphatase LpxI [Loktanella sp. SALINAS62]MBS1303641.1 LpxI family protein [Loktanella sp. SALINAS62]